MTKLLLVMRLTIILLTVACLGVHAGGFSQNVTISGRDLSLPSVFAMIRTQTGYSVFGNTAALEKAKPVTLDVKDMPLPVFMQVLLQDQPLTFTIEGDIIMLSGREFPKPEARIELIRTEALPPLTGQVMMPNGDPLAGATVKIRRNGVGTTTDADGKFYLDVKQGDLLDITYTGYLPKEVKVGKDRNLFITMTLADNKLDEIRIVAYGQNSQRFSVGNVSVIKAEDIAKAPVSNVLQAIQGRVPGLYIQQATGLSGSGMQILVEGQNSIQKGNEPFYVIDGVPFLQKFIANDIGNILGGTGTNQATGGNPLTLMNPSDIESITVLKDADATAIYGSRAANGAILITTKKGRSGATRAEANVRYGTNILPRKLHMLNTKQYLEMRHEAKRNDGIGITSTDYDLNGLYDTTRNVDWQDVIQGGHSSQMNTNASLSGGNNNVRFLINVGYLRESPLYPVPRFNNQTGSVHLSLTTNSTDQRLKADVSVTYVYNRNKLPGSDNSSFVNTLSPVHPNPYKPDGTLDWGADANGNATWVNPMANYFNTFTMEGRNLTASMRLSYEIVRGLELSSLFGYNEVEQGSVALNPLTSVRPQDLPTSERGSSFNSARYIGYNIEPQLSFSRVLGKGKLDVTAGFSINSRINRGERIYGTGYTSDRAMEDWRNARLIYDNVSQYSESKVNGGYGRITYVHAGKYIVNLTGRRDGTSNFAPDFRFHNFAAAGAGWIFSEEEFFKQLRKIISFGKINGNYGTTGNDQVGEYEYMNLYYPLPFQRPYQGGISLQPTRLINPYLQWEENKKLDIGLSLGFLKDRIVAQLDYYRNRCGNQLMFSTLSTTTGFYSIYMNRPATVQNSGYTLSINSTNIRGKAFTWNTHLNLTIARNKLLRYTDLENSPDKDLLFIGKALNASRAFPYAGVDPQTGLYTFKTAEGKISSAPDFFRDRTVFIDMTPRLYFGLDNTISWKQWQMSMFWVFTQRKGWKKEHGISMPGSKRRGQPISIWDRWQKPGDIKPVQRYSESNPDAKTAWDNFGASTGSMGDATYARLKNLSLSWTVPAGWLKKLGMKDAQLYTNVQNLLTISGLTLTDPETLDWSTMPQLRTLTAGLRITL